MEKMFAQENFRNVPEESLHEIYVNKRVKMPISPNDMVFFLDREHGDVQLRVLPYHHRSADIGVSTAIHENDSKRHIVYCQIDVKGGGFVFPEEHESKKDSITKGDLADAPEAMIIPGSQETPWGYDGLGLFDERMAMGAIHNVDKLSALGVRTEGIAGVYRLSKIMIEGKETSVAEFKKENAKKLREMAAESFDKDEQKKLRDMAKNLIEEFEPVAMVRLMRSVFRLRDMKEVGGTVGSEKTIMAMIEEACKNLNIESAELGKVERFDASTPEGREKWAEFIAYWYGKSIGVMHGEGLIHAFLHMGNLTLAGEIVDTDSVTTITEKKKFTGNKENKRKWLSNPEHADGYGAYNKRPFFKETEDGCVFVSANAGRHQMPDGRFGIPKIIMKDIRDICFSMRMFFREIVKEIPQGKNISRKVLAEKIWTGYAEGVQGKKAFEDIGIDAEKLRKVFVEVAQEVVGAGVYYPPIPLDEEE